MKALRLITRTFLEVFPEATAYLANFNALTPVFGLVGTMSPVAYPFDWFRQRVQEPGLVKALAAVGLSTDISFFGCLLGGKESLARWSATGPLNTDDKPWVMFYTPWLVYGEKPSAAVNLRELMQELHPRPRDVIVEAGGKPGREFRERVKLYRAARNLYLQGEILFAERKEDEALNAYLRSVRVSRDLKISVAKVLLMAQRRAGSDPAGAIKILLALQAADPSRDEVRILLEKLRKHLKGSAERFSPAVNVELPRGS